MEFDSASLTDKEMQVEGGGPFSKKKQKKEFLELQKIELQSFLFSLMESFLCY